MFPKVFFALAFFTSSYGFSYSCVCQMEKEQSGGVAQVEEVQVDCPINVDDDVSCDGDYSDQVLTATCINNMSQESYSKSSGPLKGVSANSEPQCSIEY